MEYHGTHRRSHSGRHHGTHQASFAGRLSQSVANQLSFAVERPEIRNGTVMGTSVNTLGSIIGAGVLSLPLALYHSSIVVGLVILFCMSLLSAYAVYCLAVGCDATQRFSYTEVVAFAVQPPKTWEQFFHEKQGGFSSPNAAEAENPAALQYAGAISSGLTRTSTSQFNVLRLEYAEEEARKRRMRRWLTILVELVIFCSNYGTLVIYSKVIADSVPPVLISWMHWDGWIVSKSFWLSVSGAIFFILSCARNMEELKWTSLLGFLTIFYIVLAIAYRYWTQLMFDEPHVSPKERGELNWTHVSGAILKTVSTYCLAFGYHYNIPYFYKELQQRRPSVMMKTVAVAFPTVVFCYATTGLVGYLTFGDLVASPHVGGNIVSNYPIDDTVVNVGRLGLFAHFVCVYPVVSICTRRGLHRLIMVGLTWSEQSAKMEAAARGAGGLPAAYSSRDLEDAQTDEEADRGSTRPGGEHLETERAPLLRRTPGYETLSLQSAPSSRVGQQVQSGREAEEGDSGSGSDEPLGFGPPRPFSRPVQNGDDAGEDDVDRDVGSPDSTTNLAIALEAALLVGTSVVMAASVSGIDVVINIIGTLFSVFLILVAPGMVGWSVFSSAVRLGASGSDSGATSVYRFVRLKRILCVVSVLLGLALMSIGSFVFIQAAVRNHRRKDDDSIPTLVPV